MNMRIQILYFAQLRERFGQTGESLDLPADVLTVADLIAHLAARGGVWQEELAKGAALRIALNQEMVTENTALTDGAEVAVFRPVTGG